MSPRSLVGVKALICLPEVRENRSGCAPRRCRGRGCRFAAGPPSTPPGPAGTHPRAAALPPAPPPLLLPRRRSGPGAAPRGRRGGKLGSSHSRAQRGTPAPRGAPSAAPGPPRPALTIRGSCWTCPWGPRPEGRRARCEGAVRRHLPPPRQALRGALVRGSRDRPALGSARPPAPAPRPPRCASAQNGRRSPTRKRGGRSLSSAYMAGGRPRGATGNRVQAAASSRPRPLLRTRSPGGRGRGGGACAIAGHSSLGPVGSERRPTSLIGREAPAGGDVSGQTWQLGRVSARAGRGRGLVARGGAGRGGAGLGRARAPSPATSRPPSLLQSFLPSLLPFLPPSLPAALGPSRCPAGRYLSRWLRLLRAPRAARRAPAPLGARHRGLPVPLPGLCRGCGRPGEAARTGQPAGFPAEQGSLGMRAGLQLQGGGEERETPLPCPCSRSPPRRWRAVMEALRFEAFPL